MEPPCSLGADKVLQAVAACAVLRSMEQRANDAALDEPLLLAAVTAADDGRLAGHASRISTRTLNELVIARALRVSLADQRARMAALLGDLVRIRLEIRDAAAVHAHIRGTVGLWLQELRFPDQGRPIEP